jgi:hypothetical protein
MRAEQNGKVLELNNANQTLVCNDVIFIRLCKQAYNEK